MRLAKTSLTKTKLIAIMFACMTMGLSFAQQNSQQEDFVFYSPLAQQWYEAGQYFEWTSTTADNNARTLQIHYRTFGDSSKPAILMLHGYPTSSFDFREMIAFLEEDYYIATLDFPGFGFSEKPLGNYSYLLDDDAKLVDYYVREIVGLKDFSLFTHDRGVSVGLAFLGNYLDQAEPGYEINYHFLSNSGMFLPLANLTEGQTVLLDADKGAASIRRLLAQPRRTEGSAMQLAYGDIQAFNNGIEARLGVGKYLLERVVHEYRWLDNLTRSPIPVAYIWGLLDPVNPIRTANYVWDEYLNKREVESSYWIMPTASHYPQRDRPEEMAAIVRLALTGQVPDVEVEDDFMWSYNRTRTEHSAIFVGHSNIEAVEFKGSVEYTPSGYR